MSFTTNFVNNISRIGEIIKNKFVIVSMILLLFVGVAVVDGTTVVDNTTTSGWTSANVTLTNATIDLSSSNVSIGFLWDTFDDSIIASAWSQVGSVTEENGYITITGSGAGVTIPSTIVDNFNVSVGIKTVQNGILNAHVPQFIFLYSQGTNYTSYYIQRSNVTANVVMYKSVANGVTNGTYDRFANNKLKINTYGDTVDAYINGLLDSHFVHVNISNVKTATNLLYVLANGGSASVIGQWDNLRYWQNNTGTIDIWQQNATQYYSVNRTRLIISNTDANLTVDLYAKSNSSSEWTLVQSNVSNNTWYNITTVLSADFRVVLNGNESDAPIFTSLEWDSNFSVVSIDGYVSNAFGARLKDAYITAGAQSVLTDANGYYSFSNILADNYSVLARAIGYRNNTNVSEITTNITINFTMGERPSGSGQVLNTPGFESILALFGLLVIVFTRKSKC